MKWKNMNRHFQEISLQRKVPAKADTFRDPKMFYVAYLVTHPVYVFLHPCTVAHTLKGFSSGEIPPIEW